MTVEMKMPDLGTTQDEVKVLEWLVEVGQPVRRGEALLQVETDKAAMEVEAVATGVLAAVHAEAGDEIPTGQVIAIIEVTAHAGSPASGGPASAGEDRPAPVSEEQVIVAPAAETSGALASPSPAGRQSMFARNRQAALDVDEHPESIPLSSVQRTVARRMTESKQTIPHFYVQTSANAESMAARRSTAAEAGKKLLWDAFFVFATGAALARYDRMCFRFENDRLVPQGTDDVGLAVDLDGKLFVVPIADPASRTIEQISGEIVTAVERLRCGDTEAMKIRPANITVTNLGVSNVESFVAVINPPESAILSVGKVAPAAVVDGGRVVVQNRVSLTLSVDHRVASGRYAGDFLGEIVRQLESL